MSTYNKFPAISLDGQIKSGWQDIISFLKNKAQTQAILLVETYSGINYNECVSNFKNIEHDVFIETKDLFKPLAEIEAITKQFMTPDQLFGYMSNLTVADYFDVEKLAMAGAGITASGSKTIIFGPGASLITQQGLLVYADMPRWEILLRMRKKEVAALGIDNSNEPFSFQYKRGYFNDWKVLDKHKQNLFAKVDFWLDTTKADEPKLIDKNTFYAGLEKAASAPFRVMPFFDAAPWGGQWMKEAFDLDRSIVNYGWGFDCVPEENSLLLDVNGIIFEMPSVNLVYEKSEQLLGKQVVSRFGKEFPIRFDFLDTMEGGNLSLQVHPTTQYVHDHFGIHYTQDESYYMWDAKEGAYVYMGLKSGINKEEMIADLEKARDYAVEFNADQYVNKIPAKKHDHFLIPAGTVHCSAKNSLVLEISATPNLFTFKLWDWNRLGLDGKPRPNNVERGKKVIDWERDTAFVNNELVNHFEKISEGEGWLEERTGLHKTEFIETRRHSFTRPVLHYTNGSVNVLNLVEGEEIIVESTTRAFAPYIIHYAETFIVPASVKEYTIKPNGPSVGKECKTLKAFVRF